MGCGSSTPKTTDYGNTTTAASHRAARTKPGDERSEFDIGPGYKAVKHLGAEPTGRALASSCNCMNMTPPGPAHACAAATSCWKNAAVPSPLTSADAHLCRPCAGQGGTGDTWQFKDVNNGRDVAVKFIKRPLPKVLQTNILREFTVSRRRCRPAHALDLFPSCLAAVGAHCGSTAGCDAADIKGHHRPCCRSASRSTQFAQSPAWLPLPSTLSWLWALRRLCTSSLLLRDDCCSVSASADLLRCSIAATSLPQIQADLGFGHEHVIKAYEAVLTPTHLCLGGCYAAAG